MRFDFYLDRKRIQWLLFPRSLFNFFYVWKWRKRMKMAVFFDFVREYIERSESWGVCDAYKKPNTYSSGYSPFILGLWIFFNFLPNEYVNIFRRSWWMRAYRFLFKDICESVLLWTKHSSIYTRIEKPRDYQNSRLKQPIENLKISNKTLI